MVDLRAAAWLGSHKLIQGHNGGDIERAFYDLAADPTESSPTGAPSQELLPLQTALDDWLENLPAARFCEGDGMTPAVEKQLEALGYLQ